MAGGIFVRCHRSLLRYGTAKLNIKYRVHRWTTIFSGEMEIQWLQEQLRHLHVYGR